MKAGRRLVRFVGRLLLLLSLAPWPALAGSQLPCSEPRVFQGAAVNAFVLPFRYVGNQPTPELLQASRQISALVHFEILYGMLKYGAVGGTDLVAVPGRLCDVDEVVDRVTRGSGPGVMRPGQTLVLVWGRLYEEGEQLYLQSYLRFLRQGASGPERETLRVALAGGSTALELRGGLPVQAIAFPPRRIGRADLARVAADFRTAMVVRPVKDMNAPGQSIDFVAERPFPYGITRAEGDWMWIQPMAGGPAGWVRARQNEAAGAERESSLQRWMPELAFVDAAAGFMRLRAGSGLAGAARERALAAIDAGLARFERAFEGHSEGGEAGAALGLGRAMQGFARWDAGPGTAAAAARAQAAELFAQARSRMPEYAAARNLAAITRPLLRAPAEAAPGPMLDARSLDRLARELTGALALDPADAQALENMDRVYRVYATRRDWSPFDSEELAARRAVIQANRPQQPARNW
jgi:hypothetical protein